MSHPPSPPKNTTNQFFFFLCCHQSEKESGSKPKQTKKMPKINKKGVGRGKMRSFHLWVTRKKVSPSLARDSAAIVMSRIRTLSSSGLSSSDDRDPDPETSTSISSAATGYRRTPELGRGERRETVKAVVMTAELL